jgi:AAA domain/Primase C terminal 1 (PriCT-1)/Bifunctional DNA primase/polymerase, N-terminal
VSVLNVLSAPVPQPDANGEFKTPAEGAKYMASYGIPQIPLKGKAPFQNDWTNKSTTDFAEIDKLYAEFKCNFGSLAQAKLGGHFVFEVDSANVRSRFNGETANEFTPTLTIQSRELRGHRWYLQSQESITLGNVSQNNVVGEDFSVRVDREQAVSPGSVHPETGTQYRVAVGIAPVEASSTEVAWFGKQRTTKKKIAAADDNTPVVKGSRNSKLASLCGKWRASGLDARQIEVLALAENEHRFEPPLGEDEVLRTVASICSYEPAKQFNLKIGGKLPEDTISATRPQLPAGFDANLLNLPKGKSNTPFEELSDLSNKDQVSWIFQNVGIPEDELSDEPQSWLIDQMLLEHGLHLFSGKPGSMKSLLALMLCKAACSAEPFLGRKNIGAPVKAVYIDHENPQSEVRKRCFGLGLLHLPNFRVWGDWREDEAPLVSFDDPRLIECAKRDKPFFVFDSLSSFLNGADENSAGEMMVIMKKAYALARMCAGVGILHHTPKNGPPSARGVGAIAATTDMSFIVQKSDRNVTLSEDRFRPCGNYTMGFSMDFGDMTGVYTATLTKDTTTSMPEAPVSRLEELKEKDRLATEAANEQHYKEKAVQVIQAAYADGQAVCSRSVLCGLIGLSPDSAFAKRLLTGKDENPWTCVQNNRSLMFLPKGITEVPAKRVRVKLAGPEVLFSGPLHKVVPVAPAPIDPAPIDLNSTDAVSS